MKELIPPTLLFLLLIIAQTAPAQQEVKLVVEPQAVQIEVTQSVQLEVKAYDADGKVLTGGQAFFLPLRKEGAVPTSGFLVDSTGLVSGLIPGTYNLIVGNWFEKSNQFGRTFVKVEVLPGVVGKIDIHNLPEHLFAGAIVPLEVTVTDEHGFPMDASEAKLRVANEKVATVDNLSNLYAKAPGKTQLLVQAGDVKMEVDLEVIKNPVERIQLQVGRTVVRTGDVLAFSATAWDRNGKQLMQVPFYYAVSGEENEKGAGASALIEKDGRFVAEKPGTYTVMASSGDKSAIKTVKVVPRNVNREIQLIGRGAVRDKHTSDFWVWKGADGNDYAVTGTWGADGKAYFWNVTDPGHIRLIDSVQVDARTVNDVKVSEDGKICVISREGASSRKNGIVILDVTDPSKVEILATYTDQLTGGVHNLFIYKDHVYALSNGQRYEIINIEDPTNPRRVGKFELDNPARSIHDVWIEDGIAYSSNWNDGVVLVDIGNGLAGGSPGNPVEIARSRVEGDANHAAFPFRSSSTGKFYVIAGDEIFPTFFFSNPNADREVFNPAGYLHFIDFTDPDHPKEVARYEVPEAGSHNFWVEDDILYVGYYNGGVRVVDISGDLMGDLYKQGREIAHFVPKDPEGYVPNHAMTWGAQPHNGHIFFSDFNSGLWAAKVVPPLKEELKD